MHPRITSRVDQTTLTTGLIWADGIVNGLLNEIRYHFGHYRETSTTLSGMLSPGHIAKISAVSHDPSTGLMTSINNDDFTAKYLWAHTVVDAGALTTHHIVNKLCRI